MNSVIFDQRRSNNITFRLHIATWVKVNMFKYLKIDHLKQADVFEIRGKGTFFGEDIVPVPIVV